MSKTSDNNDDTSNIAPFEDHNTLADSELDAVSGGMLMLSTVQLRDLLPFGGGGGSRGACKEQLSAQAA